MDREFARLELLKLTYSHGRDAEEAVDRAKVLEDYILPSPIVVPEAKTEAVSKAAAKAGKKAGNLDILS